jgi:cell division septation protein DedD
MKRSLTLQEQALRSQGRHRMIGAATIMVIVVLLLPMILNHSMGPKLAEAPQSAPDALPTAVALPSPNPAPATNDAEPAAKPVAAADAVAPVAALTALENAATPPAAIVSASASVPAPTVQAVPSAAPAANGIMLQVGVFSNADKATFLAKRLNKQGIHTVAEVVHYEQGDRTRVRVGPVANRAEAADMKARLEKIGLASVIQSH